MKEVVVFVVGRPLTDAICYRKLYSVLAVLITTRFVLTFVW